VEQKGNKKARNLTWSLLG